MALGLYLIREVSFEPSLQARKCCESPRFKNLDWPPCCAGFIPFPLSRCVGSVEQWPAKGLSLKTAYSVNTRVIVGLRYSPPDVLFSEHLEQMVWLERKGSVEGWEFRVVTGSCLHFPGDTIREEVPELTCWRDSEEPRPPSCLQLGAFPWPRGTLLMTLLPGKLRE